MASRGPSYIGTTHSDLGGKGSHQTVPRVRFAVPIRGLVKGMPLKAKTAPWFLKHPLERPGENRMLKAKAVA